jgi:hypothetical protein
MHPILARLERLAAYLGLWCAIGVLVGAVLTRQGLTWPEALVQVLPPLLAYSFICLSAWYVCRAMPLGTSGVPGVLTAAVVAASVAGGFWLLLNEVWLATLEAMPGLAPVTERFRAQTPLLFAVSVMLFLLVLSVHYVALAVEAFRTAERQQLELKVLTRDAELRALRAQINPHFLFNSLNSISALAGSDAAGARRMCLLLAEFLRKTLALRERDEIPLGDEVALVDAFLAVEQVRFGSRLRALVRIDPEAELCLVPPLVLQPLVENAVSHGIAGLVEGGTIVIEARRAAGRIELAVVNPADPDRPRKRGHGMGLKNVRERLATRHGAAAHVDAREANGTFTVTLSFPARAPSAIEAAAASAAPSPSSSADADGDVIPGRAPGAAQA